MDLWKNPLFCFVLRANPHWKICMVSSRGCTVLLELLCMNSMTALHHQANWWESRYIGLYFLISKQRSSNSRTQISESARMMLGVLLLGLNCRVLIFKLWGSQASAKLPVIWEVLWNRWTYCKTVEVNLGESLCWIPHWPELDDEDGFEDENDMEVVKPIN